VPASARFAPAQHEDRAFDGDLQRLLTSRALRLGKPHRTFGPLTPSVTRRSPRRALRTLASAPCSKPHGPPRQVSTCAAFPLGTTPPPGPGRLPLVRSSCLAAEADLRALPFTFAHARPAPFSPTENRSSSSTRTARGGYPARHRPGALRLRATRSGKGTSTQHLQPTFDTSTQQTARISTRSHVNEARRADPRLTASLRLPQGIAHGARSPGCPAPLGPAGPVIADPPERRPLFLSPPACSAGGRGAILLLAPSVVIDVIDVCDVSDAVSRDVERRPSSANHQIRLRRRLVKDAGFAEPGSLPSAASPRPPRVRAARLREAGCRVASGELPSDFCNRMRSASTTSNRPNPGARRQPGGLSLARPIPFGASLVRDRPLRDIPAEGPRIRGPARLSPWLDAVRALGRNRAREDGETPIRVDSGTFCRKSVRCKLERPATRHPVKGAVTNLPELRGQASVSRHDTEPGRACFREARAA